ncbi:MAG: 3-deoxy-7-phosphoheptulonate synthase [Dehalococcoidia bacterium]|nr:3-deoxy-7-phosphoheptulonate synthase [Dehalococcoidia bacterium]
MIVVMKVGSAEREIDGVLERLKELGFKGSLSRGVERTVIGVVGQTYPELADELAVLEGVADVVPISRPYKLASREFKPEDTVIKVGNVTIGGGNTVVMAGQCSVDTEEQMMATARLVKEAGGHILRGGAFKPRTNPYAFRGLGEKGLQILATAREETGLPIISEVMDPRDVELVARYADILQVGSRSMQNFALLDEVGRSGKPVLLKRGMWAPLQEWLLAAEYVLAQGNGEVILCERGIRTFETSTRFTMDLSAIPAVKRLSHLPIIGDPSHATGHRYLVEPMAMASVAAGADGLIVELHPNPDQALSDGAQSLTFGGFRQLMERVGEVAKAVGRPLAAAS